MGVELFAMLWRAWMKGVLAVRQDCWEVRCKDAERGDACHGEQPEGQRTAARPLGNTMLVQWPSQARSVTRGEPVAADADHDELTISGNLKEDFGSTSTMRMRPCRQCGHWCSERPLSSS